MNHKIIFQDCFMGLLLLYQPIVMAQAGSHSLSYYFTTVNGPCPGLPLYSIVEYMDDMVIAKYNSDIQKVETVRKWMQEPGDSTKLAKEYEAKHQKTLQVMGQLFNQSSDLHIYQIKFGCELYEDGSIGGHTEFGLNGNEIIFFDKERLLYIPATREAQIITQDWNRDQSNVWVHKNLMEHECIDRIKKYISHGKHELEREVPPQVKVSGRQSNNIIQLHCWVYGFYPRAVDVWWMKNETVDFPLDEATQILPNPDGTYQTRVTIDVLVGEEDLYSCYVDHSSLEEALSVKWEAKMSRLQNSEHIGVPVAMVVAMLFCLLALRGKSFSSLHSACDYSSSVTNIIVL
ncbi:zinc-alpha-2-glycoprotein-like [Mixophyes fleayi]|uniref:zinc-alpha-2-glycoprotein-like n=1 Tax=Mixophyes fleayi TaxID=3061075 RepID=UPI003F4DAB19